MRILITGSRDWSDELQVIDALLTYYERYGADNITIVHGACPTGADKMASDFVNEFGGAEEAHPADWSQGRKAGPMRNKRMVDTGVDVCLAFISRCTSPRCSIEKPHWSHGATGTANMAVTNKVQTIRYYGE